MHFRLNLSIRALSLFHCITSCTDLRSSPADPKVQGHGWCSETRQWYTLWTGRCLLY